MASKASKIRNAEIKQIVKMMFAGKQDNDIMRELGLPQRTLTRYKQRIYQDYADQFYSEHISNIGYYSTKLHSKLTYYQTLLESKLENCTEVKDISVLVDLASDLAKTIFELEMHRLEVLDDIKSLDNKIRPYTGGGNNNNNDINIKKAIRLVPTSKE